MPRTNLSHLLLAGCLLCGSASAQQPAVVAPDGQPVPYWESHEGFRVDAAVRLILARYPYTIAAVRLAASEQPLLWPEWQFITDVALPLPAHLLKATKDNTALPDFSGKAPPSPADWAFYWLLNKALVLANDTPEENFKKSAEEHRFLQFPHLFANPSQWRGKVITVRGKLLTLRKEPAPLPAQQQGVKFVYEGWINGPTKHTNPYCVVFTELPPGLDVFEMTNRRSLPEVTFYGYFLKKFRYTAANADRLTVYLVGRTIEVEPTPPAPPADEQPFSRMVLFVVAGGVIVLVMIAIAFSWWFGRGDARTRSRLSELRERHGLDFEETPPAPLAHPPAEAAPAEHKNGTTSEHKEPRQGGPA
jgi:hypothetical protein